MTLVLVDWIDSGGYTKWVELAEIKRTSVKRIRSVGWLLQEDLEAVWIVPHRDDADPQFIAMGKGDLCIPRGVIKSIKVIDYGTEPA
jgi:hypothetical protein